MTSVPFAALLALLIAPASGTASITVRVEGQIVEATLRAPRRVFGALPANAPAALVAGSCTVRADNVVLTPVFAPVVHPVALTRVMNSGPSDDTMVTAVVRYPVSAAPKALDVSCELFPERTTLAPRPSVVLMMSGNKGRTTITTANADGRVRGAMRIGL
jgi:hypothetical protein